MGVTGALMYKTISFRTTGFLRRSRNLGLSFIFMSYWWVPELVNPLLSRKWSFMGTMSSPGKSNTVSWGWLPTPFCTILCSLARSGPSACTHSELGITYLLHEIGGKALLVAIYYKSGLLMRVMVASQNVGSPFLCSPHLLSKLLPVGICIDWDVHA